MQKGNSVNPSSNRTIQPEPQPQTGAISTGMPTSTSNRPTSSYGHRPTLASNLSLNKQPAFSTSGNNSPLKVCASTTTEISSESFDPNKQSNNSRRVSLDKKVEQPQQNHISTHMLHSGTNNANTNFRMVNQTPSLHGAAGGNMNGNQHHKRPPLGINAHNPTPRGFSSESSSKRQKQQRHHNPYNQSLSGRKSL